MNYRHAFHAANFADVIKHLTLVACLERLGQKDRALRIVDLFSGIGWYDLDGDEASRSPEWRDGLGRIEAARARGEPLPALVAQWLAASQTALAKVGLAGPSSYPGSPLLIAAALRPQDHAVLCELHPADAATLEARFSGFAGVSVQHRDGWGAVRGLMPPPDRRGLIVIDPPFEQPGEFDRMVTCLADGLDRFAIGTYLAWHATKDIAQTRAYLKAVAGMGARALHAHLQVDTPGSGKGLQACGLVVINPPFGLEEGLAETVPWLARELARGAGAAGHVERLSGVW